MLHVTSGMRVVRLQWLLTIWKTRENCLRTCNTEVVSTCVSKTTWCNFHPLFLCLRYILVVNLSLCFFPTWTVTCETKSSSITPPVLAWLWRQSFIGRLFLFLTSQTWCRMGYVSNFWLLNDEQNTKVFWDLFVRLNLASKSLKRCSG